MEQDSLISQPLPEPVSAEHLDELRETITQQLASFDNIAYSPNHVQKAKQDKAQLKKLRRSIEERRKELRRVCLEPYSAAEPRFKELVAMINRPLERINDFLAAAAPPEEPAVTGYQVLKLTSTPEQMAKLLEQAQQLGIGVGLLEDGMPKTMRELTAPDLSSVVAFDIETTDTHGADNGDDPAEITEIGAVKVVDGKIVAQFSELANPGREIFPNIARLTHITGEMVQDKPPIEEVIRAFKDFIGDSILVGHSIKSCDIPHIVRAAKRAGVTLDNDYFDTYRYAKALKEKMGWESVKLEYLAQQFGISQSDAHRAWCDAEVNVGVYFRLKELS